MSDVDTIVSNLSGQVAPASITLMGVLRLLLTVVLGVVIIRALLKILDRVLERSKSLAPLKKYVYSVVKVLLWIILALAVLGSLGVEITSVIALLSVAGLAVSLALQNTLSNVAGGIMLLATGPFQVGDYMSADGVEGTVSALGLSYTTFVTFDNKEIFLPNSQLAGTKITNFTALGKRRVDVKFTASYDAPSQEVKAALREVVDSIPQVLPDPAPAIKLSEYQSSSIQYVVRVWAAASDYWDVYFALMEGVRDAFARHDVEITYDHLNVHMVG